MIDYHEQIEYDDAFAEFASKPNLLLFELTAKSKSDIVNDIRKTYQDWGIISVKQRNVLAKYLAEEELTKL